MKSRKILYIFIVLLIPLIFISCKPKNDGDGVKKPVKDVLVQVIKKQDFISSKLTSSGTVVPVQHAVIRSLTPGTVQYIAPVGSTIFFGQPLYAVTDSNIENNYFNSQRNFEQTEIIATQRVSQSELGLNGARARYEFAQKNLENTKTQAENSLVFSIRSGVSTYNTSHNLFVQIMNYIVVGPTENRNFVYSSLRVKVPQMANDAQVFFDNLVYVYKDIKPLSSEEVLEQHFDTLYTSFGSLKAMVDHIVLMLQNATPGDYFTESRIESERLIMTNYQAQINQTMGLINTAQNNIKNTIVLNDLQIKNSENQLELAKIELDNSEISQSNAQESAELERSISQSQLNTSSYHYNNLTLSSPFSGTVLSHLASVGQQVQPGQEVIEIGNLKNVEIELEIDAAFLPGIKINDPVIVDKMYDGIITEIEPAGSIDSGKVGLKVHADNSEGKIVAGSIALVDLTLEFKSADSIIVPLKAVTIDISGNFVFIVEEGKVIRKEVSLGQVYGDQVSVVFGLEEGDVLILPNGIFISEGDEVSIVDEKE